MPRPRGAILAACLLIAGCASTSAPSTRTPRPIDTAVAHAGQVFDAVIERPRPDADTHWAALLIGGGLGNDLDWTTPGSITVAGVTTPITISGQPHANAPAISRALSDEGFTVLRWTTIARGDPLADQWPIRATPRSLAELTDQARAALDTLRRTRATPFRGIVLIAHSLGAPRACALAAEDPQIRAIILLSPAYITTDPPPPKALAEAALEPCEAALRRRPVPCLALFGSLDRSRAVNAQGAARLAASGEIPALEVHIFEGLGHELGPQQDARTDAMDPGAIHRLARWAGQIARHHP